MLSPLRGRRGARVVRGAAGLSVLLGLAAVPGWAAPPVPQPAPPSQVAPASQAPAVFAYTREVQETDDTMYAMQTAIRRFDPVSGKGPTIYLVAAVHIGEKSYYQHLQTFLNKQDIVLFERVNPPLKRKASPPPPAATTVKTTPPVHLYKQLSEFLNLQFQPDGINYNQPHFRNSDLAWDDMEVLAAKSGAGTQKELTELHSMLDGGGSAATMLSTVAKQADDDPEFAKLFRRVVVELLANPDKITALRPPRNKDQAHLDTILVAERNKVVLADLKALTTRPKPPRSIAIFYGAAHMHDIAQHLSDDLHYRPSTTQWLTALTAP